MKNKKSLKIALVLLSFGVFSNYSLAQETLQTVTERGNLTNTQVFFGQVNHLGLRWGFNGDLASLYYSNNLNGYGKLFLDIGDDNLTSQAFQIRGVRYDGQINDIAYFGGNGNVGVGTTTPTEKLSVNGKIRAKEIKVEATGWPDYVFEEDYKVTSLAELESFIKKHKHLPEVPSAKEVQQNGVELGEMNKILLKKIEELTLMLIEKDKELKGVLSEMKQRAIDIDKLSSRIENLEKK